ncbi:MAG: DinB family protein [Gemmatimonadota bacterium]|nr:DinB family protein [Gemmatimonadota bacterium]
MTPELRDHERLLRYDIWANAEALRSLRQGDPPGQLLRWMGHIVGSYFIKMARLLQEPPTLPVWPELDLDDCAARLNELADAWPRYLQGLAAEDLEDGVGYRNSKGEFWTSSVTDIMSHVVIHSGYHRGQIATGIRQAGGTPAYTDFIHAVRQGLVG